MKRARQERHLASTGARRAPGDLVEPTLLHMDCSAGDHSVEHSVWLDIFAIATSLFALAACSRRMHLWRAFQASSPKTFRARWATTGLFFRDPGRGAGR